MKRFLTLTTMLVMLCSASLTVNAAKSPAAEKVDTQPAVTQTSPKTGESDLVLYGLGASAAVLTSAAVIVRRKEMAI